MQGCILDSHLMRQFTLELYAPVWTLYRCLSKSYKVLADMHVPQVKSIVAVCLQPCTLIGHGDMPSMLNINGGLLQRYPLKYVVFTCRKFACKFTRTSQSCVLEKFESWLRRSTSTCWFALPDSTCTLSKTCKWALDELSKCWDVDVRLQMVENDQSTQLHAADRCTAF